MQYTRNFNFTKGNNIVADEIDLEFDSIASVLNAGIDTANIVDGAVTPAKLSTNANPETRTTEMFVDGVYTGLTLNPTSGWTTLVATLEPGTAYIRGVRVSREILPNRTFLASRDTYVDLSKTGTYEFVDVANGAAEPAVTPNSLRIMKVVTDGTKITAWYDLRPWQWITVGEAGGPAFQNSWVVYDTTFNKCQFMKDRTGMVLLRGMVESGTDEAVVYTLPTGFRPVRHHLFVVASADAFGRVDVTDDGLVDPTISSNVWISLDSIRFRTD